MTNKQRSSFAGAVEKAKDDPLAAFISIVDPSNASTSQNSGALAGIPYAVKDNIDTVALPTTSNTPALVGSRRKTDHEVVARLQAAGAVLVGKTSLHELAFGITNGAAAYPAARNPFDTTRSSGGSSGGSGAAVGSGIVPFAIGTDTGGSVSIPAAWCGVYGYRPSLDRWPTGGAAPLSKTRDAVGVIAESFEYLHRIDEVVRDRSSEIAVSAPIRVGVPRKNSQYLAPLAADVQEVWEKALQQLGEANGAIELVEVETDQLHELDAACGIGIVLYESVRDLSAYLATLPFPVTFEQVLEQAASEDVRELLSLAWQQRNNHAEYRELMVTHQLLRGQWDRLFADNRLIGLLRPTSPITAVPVGDDFMTTAFGEQVPTFGTVIRNTGPGSTAGQPAITIPAGVGSAGLPVGVSIDGSRGQDDALFALAAEIDARIGVRSLLLP